MLLREKHFMPLYSTPMMYSTPHWSKTKFWSAKKMLCTISGIVHNNSTQIIISKINDALASLGDYPGVNREWEENCVRHPMALHAHRRWIRSSNPLCRRGILVYTVIRNVPLETLWYMGNPRPSPLTLPHSFDIPYSRTRQISRLVEAAKRSNSARNSSDGAKVRKQ